MLRLLAECIGMVVLFALALIAGMGAADRAIGATPSISRPSPYLFEGSTVVRVDCVEKHGPAWGTAFYLGSGVFMTAAHVLEGSVCQIGGKPLKIIVISKHPDYAMVRADFFPPFRVNPNCGRLVEGQSYIATGYAGSDRGDISQEVVTATGIDDRHDQDTEVNGSIVGGMSGGPVFDLSGTVHGINVWRDGDGVPISGVVELADTVLCTGKSR